MLVNVCRNASPLVLVVLHSRPKVLVGNRMPRFPRIIPVPHEFFFPCIESAVTGLSGGLNGVTTSDVSVAW